MAGAKFGIMGPASNSLARWLGLEIDASWIQTKIKQQDVQLSVFGRAFGAVPMDETKVQLITGALHVIAKYPDGPVQPYIGAGPAVVHARVSDSGTFTSGTATALGLSGIAGLRFKVSERIGLFAEYKYIRASPLKFNDLEAEAVIHAAVGGLNLAF
jgi:opacity protein-like surface antigen